MKFRLCEEWTELDRWCFAQLAPELGLEEDPAGIPLHLVQMENPGCRIENGEAWICWNARHQIWRELGLLSEHSRDFTLTEAPAYGDLGVMLDCSRNGVLSETAVMDLMRRLLLMGYGSMQLYTEDTYEIEGEPYFGYQRGAYSREELRRLDDYAWKFGMELIPCIQTLAHLDCVLHWKTYEQVRDFGNILLADREQTYELIEKMVAGMAGSLRSRRINIGMDEAHMLGRGKHLDLNGYEDPSRIMLRHYGRVIEILKRYGYRPMMWSDMFFRLISGGEYYSDREETTPFRDSLDPDTTLVYWDYYSLDSEQYDRMFRRHRKITSRIAFAGGAWKWEGPCPNSRYSQAAARAAHESCRRNGVSQVLITAWGDNGDECPVYSVLPAFSQWAELCYENQDSDAFMERRFHTCTGGSYRDFLHLGDGVLMPDNPAPGRCGVNPLRYLLYQNLLGGLFDAHTDLGQREHLLACARTMAECRDRARDRYKYLFETQYCLDRLVGEKCMLGNEIREAYEARDSAALAECRRKALDLLPLLEAYEEAFKIQWLRENRIFGLDVQLLQLGGLREQILFTAERLKPCEEGRLPVLEELEQPALNYYGQQQMSVQSPSWRDIVTASVH